MFSSPQQQQQSLSDEDDDVDEQNRTTLLGFCSFCLELVGGSNKKQNWKGLGIAFIVITLVCLLIVAAIFLTTTQPVISHHESIPITEKDLFNVKSPLAWNGTWISEKIFSYVDENRSLRIYHCDLLQDELVFQRDLLQQEYVADGIVSPSGKFVLMPIEKGNIRTFYTEYQYDLYEKSIKIASISMENDEKMFITAVSYSNSDHLFAFISNFDIFIYNVSRKNIQRVTSDGDLKTIHNGLVEWIYEYEIFQKNFLLFWSPNNRYLAFIKINLTSIRPTFYQRYDNDEPYGYPYPKYQDSLPYLDVFIYHLKSGKTLRIPRPSTFDKNSTLYIYHVVWYCSNCLAIVYGNRGERSSLIQCYEISPDRIVVKGFFQQQTKHNGFVARYVKPYFSSNGIYAFIIQLNPLANDEQTNVKSSPRLVRIHFNQTFPQIDAFSSADVHVDEIIHIDAINQIYFLGSTEKNPLEKQFYRWKHLSNRSEIELLSDDENCSYVQVKFSLGRGNFHIRECWGPSIPYATLHNRSKQLKLINNNEPFRQWMINRSMPYIDYFTVPMEKKSIVGHGMIILPSNYNPNVTIASYPVIVSINHRLFEQRVTKKFVFLLPEFVQVMEDGLGIVLFDAHGSLGQDENYLRNAFVQQYNDYLRLARHLKLNETLNDTRFGLKAQGPAAIIALKLLEENPKENDEYRCAFLRSPVTNLSFYRSKIGYSLRFVSPHARKPTKEFSIEFRLDTIFTDRIDDLNHPNIKLPTEWILQNKSLAFVHGTADEAVHFKHSALLAKSLIENDVDFQFKFYPDVDHRFEMDEKVFNDFYHYERKFFRQCLGSRVNKERKTTIVDDHD